MFKHYLKIINLPLECDMREDSRAGIHTHMHTQTDDRVPLHGAYASRHNNHDGA